jgi:hypothetical protein
MVGVTTVHRVVLAAGDVLLAKVWLACSTAPASRSWALPSDTFALLDRRGGLRAAVVRHDASPTARMRAVMDVAVQVAGRATEFDAWILVAESALAASGQMGVPATALSKRTLPAMT